MENMCFICNAKSINMSQHISDCLQRKVRMLCITCNYQLYPSELQSHICKDMYQTKDEIRLETIYSILQVYNPSERMLPEVIAKMDRLKPDIKMHTKSDKPDNKIDSKQDTKLDNMIEKTITTNEPIIKHDPLPKQKPHIPTSIDPKKVITRLYIDNKEELEHTISKIELPISKNIINHMKSLRLSIMESTPLQDYIQYLQKVNGLCTKVLQTKTKTQNTCSKNLLLTMTSVDSRMLLYPKFTYTQLMMSDVASLKNCINKTFPLCNIPKCRSMSDFSLICNYGLVLLFDDLIIVYIKSLPIIKLDSVRFFTLKCVEKKSRIWTFDNRLYEFTTSLIDTLQDYLVTLFKKVYYDQYTDNVYRETYTDDDYFKMEGNHIIKILKKITDKPKFLKYIQDIVPEYQPDNKDIIPESNDYMDPTLEMTCEFNTIEKLLFEQSNE